MGQTVLKILTATEEKLHYILEGMSEGKLRSELSEKMGYKTSKCMDGFMRRQGYHWDVRKERYELKIAKAHSGGLPEPPEKVRRIIEFLAEANTDLKKAASELGYADHHALADYMRSEEYEWDAETKNYGYSEKRQEEKLIIEEVICENNYKEDASQVMEEIRKLLPHLKALTDNQAQNQTEKTVPILPHYRVPGIAVTKSVRLVYPLVDMAEHFCHDHGLSQREFFELALVETLQRYGDVEAVSAILV